MLHETCRLHGFHLTPLLGCCSTGVVHGAMTSSTPHMGSRTTARSVRFRAAPLLGLTESSPNCRTSPTCRGGLLKELVLTPVPPRAARSWILALTPGCQVRSRASEGAHLVARIPLGPTVLRAHPGDSGRIEGLCDDSPNRLPRSPRARRGEPEQRVDRRHLSAPRRAGRTSCSHCSAA